MTSTVDAIEIALEKIADLIKLKIAIEKEKAVSDPVLYTLDKIFAFTSFLEHRKTLRCIFLQTFA